MYQRYTSRSEGLQSSRTPRVKERIRNILLIVLAVACILLAIFGGRAHTDGVRQRPEPDFHAEPYSRSQLRRHPGPYPQPPVRGGYH